MKTHVNQFLSKRDKAAVDFATEALLLRLLDAGEVRVFNTIIGLIQDLKDATGRISTGHEKCLRLPLALFEVAVKA